MSIEKRVEATAKNIEGKAQEFVGEVTGNLQDQAEGKMKQKEAQAQHVVENSKDRVKEELERNS
ncbi:MAG: CsbD family protein [Microcoleaceae cyanobacterium]